MTYEQALQEILTHGRHKSDRTGTGTTQLFGMQMRFDLADGFPLITTKKMFFGGAIDELLWFISGSTNANDLPGRTRQWWTPWQRANGDLGPIYGEQYRRARWWFDVEPELYEPHTPEVANGASGVGRIGSEYRTRGQPAHIVMLKAVWCDMLKRCYDESSKGFAAYGALGVHVCPEWIDFGNFARDAQQLPNWELKLCFPDGYSLDKDILKASNRYSPGTCMWASHDEQGWNTSTNRPFTAKSPDGEVFTFPSIREMQRDQGINLSAVHRCLNGLLKTHHGWSEFKYADAGAKVRRFRELDQLRRVIASIKTNPSSRRHVINLWNGPAMEHAALPCCHGSVIQFDVTDGLLSCQMYQRSADMFLGVPVNIASYALLTHMVAQQCDLAVGEFIWIGGDCHIYDNHREQVALQLSRERRPLPRLALRQAASIFDYTPDDIVVVGYDPHPAIKAPVAV